jgi:hypothetical protein
VASGIEADEGRWGRSTGHIRWVKVRCKSAWLLHFAAAPPIRWPWQPDVLTALIGALQFPWRGVRGGSTECAIVLDSPGLLLWLCLGAGGVPRQASPIPGRRRTHEPSQSCLRTYVHRIILYVYQVRLPITGGLEHTRLLAARKHRFATTGRDSVSFWYPMFSPNLPTW